MSPFLLCMGSFIIGLLSKEIRRTKGSQIKCDQDSSLMRGEGQPAGVVFANFLVHNLHYLNITPLMHVSVNGFVDCGMKCVAVSSCFSANVGAFADLGQKTLCELLPSDKYSESSKFIVSERFHHFSIMVGQMIEVRKICKVFFLQLCLFSTILLVFIPSMNLIKN